MLRNEMSGMVKARKISLECNFWHITEWVGANIWREGGIHIGILRIWFIGILC